MRWANRDHDGQDRHYRVGTRFGQAQGLSHNWRRLLSAEPSPRPAPGTAEITIGKHSEERFMNHVAEGIYLEAKQTQVVTGHTASRVTFKNHYAMVLAGQEAVLYFLGDELSLTGLREKVSLAQVASRLEYQPQLQDEVRGHAAQAGPQAGPGPGGAGTHLGRAAPDPRHAVAASQARRLGRNPLVGADSERGL